MTGERYWNDGELLRLAVETISEVDRKVGILMSDVEQLGADTGALVTAFGQLTSDLAAGLTDLHAQAAGAQPGDMQALQQIDNSIVGLLQRVQSADAMVKAADPGPQPEAPVSADPASPDAPVAPLPDETATPVPSETPESPVAPVDDPSSVPVAGDAPVAPDAPVSDPNGDVPVDASADPNAVAPGPVAETPDAPVDPAPPFDPAV